MRTVISTSASVFILMILIFVLHEGAHFIAAKALGNEAILSINHVRPATGEWNRPSDAFRITAAGPVSTILLGLFGFVWAISPLFDLGAQHFTSRIRSSIDGVNRQLEQCQ